MITSGNKAGPESYWNKTLQGYFGKFYHCYYSDESCTAYWNSSQFSSTKSMFIAFCVLSILFGLLSMFWYYEWFEVEDKVVAQENMYRSIERSTFTESVEFQPGD